MIPVFIVCMLFVLAMTSLHYAHGGSQGLWQAHWETRRKGFKEEWEARRKR